MTIDVHAHYMSPGMVEALRRRTEAPCIRRFPDGSERRIMPAGNTLPFTDAYTDIKARIDLMDMLGVRAQLLMPCGAQTILCWIDPDRRRVEVSDGCLLHRERSTGCPA